jgi:hypothetical protein
MKTVWLFLLLLFSNLSFSQSFNSIYHGFLEELYFDRQPSAKAQSMGGGLSAYTENEFGTYYNPALTSLSEGLTVNTSFSSNYKNYIDGKFNFQSASYKVKNVGSFGLSRNYLSYQTEYYYYGKIISESYHSIYTLNYSREIFKDFYAGININALTPHFNGQDEPRQIIGTTYPIDVGILVKIHFLNSSTDISQLMQIGSSLYNLNGVRYDDGVGLGNTKYYPLPIIFRLDTSYNVKIKKNNFLKSHEIFSFLGQVELEWVPNSGRFVKIKLGSEVILLNIFSLRGGYIVGNKYEANVKDIYNLAYGMGLKIPLNLIFQAKSPLTLSIDYVNLKQPPLPNFLTSSEYDEIDRYNTLSLNLNWSPTF